MNSFIEYFSALTGGFPVWLISLLALFMLAVPQLLRAILGGEFLARGDGAWLWKQAIAPAGMFVAILLLQPSSLIGTAVIVTVAFGLSCGLAAWRVDERVESAINWSVVPGVFAGICIVLPSTLATITSESENERVVEQFNRKQNALAVAAAIGDPMQATDGTWRCVVALRGVQDQSDTHQALFRLVQEKTGYILWVSPADDESVRILTRLQSVGELDDNDPENLYLLHFDELPEGERVIVGHAIRPFQVR